MISMQELLHGHTFNDMPHQHELNLEELLKRLNVIRTAWGKPLTVTSGYRDRLQQERINPKAMQSNHMIGAAADLLDEDGSFNAWLKSPEGLKLMEEVGLWGEERQGPWQHLQLFPPKSGHRFFRP